MGDRAAGLGDQIHLRGVDPDRVCRAEAGPEDTVTMQVVGERGAIAALGGFPLDRGLREMGLQCKAVIIGEIATAAQERIRAVMRDGRCDTEADLVRGIRPIGGDIAQCGERGVGRAGANGFRDGSQFGRERVQQAGNCLIEAAIGDHGRDHGPHPDIGIGTGDVVDSRFGRYRQHGREIEAGGAALPDHLHGR